MTHKTLPNFLSAPAKSIWFVWRRSFFEAPVRTNRLIALGWLAQIGFPLYYWVWTYVFPQPYENLMLRLTGMAVTVPLFFASRLRRTRWFDAYFFGAITYVFPFFFVFMFLMNGGSSVWSQSLLIAVTVLFLFEIRFAVLSAILGTSLACLACFLSAGHHELLFPETLANIPIVVFAILCASIIGRNILAEEQVKGMIFALGTVSHELRTPLRSVDASARGLKRYLPALVSFYEKHHQASEADLLLSNRVIMMGAALDRIQTDVQYMNSAIDLLLANAGDARKDARSAQHFNIGEVIMDAVRRYPFENTKQRALVTMELDTGFAVLGNAKLFVMVIFNLLKNALRAVAKAGKGEIRIATHAAEDGWYVIFRDTGCGIPDGELPHIFRRMYSYPSDMGTGIGLAFCRDTLEAWGATITCRSEEHVYTEFLIRFPGMGENMEAM